MNKPTQVTTNEVRISYEHLTKPYAQKLGEPEKYSATLLIPKHDFATKQRIDAAIAGAIALYALETQPPRAKSFAETDGFWTLDI